MNDAVAALVWLAVNSLLVASAWRWSRRLFPRDGLGETTIHVVTLPWPSQWSSSRATRRSVASACGRSRGGSCDPALQVSPKRTAASRTTPSAASGGVTGRSSSTRQRLLSRSRQSERLAAAATSLHRTNLA